MMVLVNDKCLPLLSSCEQLVSISSHVSTKVDALDSSKRKEVCIVVL